MSNIVEKNFSGFVKVVIGATGLLAMGAVVAGSALVKGFKEGAKATRYATKASDKKTDSKTQKNESAETSDETEERTANDSHDEEN